MTIATNTMNRSNRLLALALTPLLMLACGKPAAPDPDAAEKGDPKSGPVTLNGSGSTFQKAFQESAIEAFKKASPNITINYGGGGSGKGRQDLADLVTDFAGSDSGFKDADLDKVKGGQILYFPILLGPIAITFNVAGVDKLQLGPVTLAKIYQREITTWNDAAIAADNPGVTLPANAIVVARRADGSGTTDNFTKYLVSAAPDAWKLKSGSTVEWPADTQAGQGNGGVAQIVKSTAGAIGYVDLSDAKASGLKYASIQNAAGKFIVPSAESASAAGEGVEVKDNLLFGAVNAAGEGAYPITSPSWLIVYAKPSDAAKSAALMAYLTFLLGEGQKLLPELDFAPLPRSLLDKAVAQLAKLAEQAKPSRGESNQKSGG